MKEKLVISLGSSCDTANQLKRIGINHIHYFLISFGMNMMD